MSSWWYDLYYYYFSDVSGNSEKENWFWVSNLGQFLMLCQSFSVHFPLKNCYNWPKFFKVAT